MAQSIKHNSHIKFIPFSLTCFIPICLIFLLIGCGPQKEEVYLGGWEEAQLSFLPHIQQPYKVGSYLSDIVSYKFGGHSSDIEGAVSWLRNPTNLQMVFHTMNAVGLEKIVNKTTYEQPLEAFGADWKGKSPRQIVSEFLASDTSALAKEPYFTEFWERRRQEGTLSIVHAFLRQVEAFYEQDMVAEAPLANDTLKNLLTFSYQLRTVAPEQETDKAYEYFQYLTQIGLAHSAYELAWNYVSFPSASQQKVNVDSLVSSLKPDTLSEDQWNDTRFNTNGWIDYQSLYQGP